MVAEEVMTDKELIEKLEQKVKRQRERFIEYVQKNGLLTRDAAEFEVDRLCGDDDDES